MSTLTAVLQNPAKRGAVIRDGVLLIDSEVKSKRGVSGLAVKAGFKAVKKVKPGIIAEALEMLMPEFAPAIDPIYAKGRDAGDAKNYLVRNADEVADALLKVTDTRAERAKNRVLIKVYRSLRSQARGHVVAAVPGLAGLIDKHLG
jgi:hypothetical protein